MGKTHQIPLPIERPIQAPRLPENSELRKWARKHRFQVGDRGRIPTEVEQAYLQQQLEGLR